MANSADSLEKIELKLFKNPSMLDSSILVKICATLDPSLYPKENQRNYMSSESQIVVSPETYEKNDLKNFENKTEETLSLTNILENVEVENRLFRELIIELMTMKVVDIKNKNPEIQKIISDSTTNEAGKNNKKFNELEAQLTDYQVLIKSRTEEIRNLNILNSNLSHQLETNNSEIKRIVLQDQKPKMSLLDNSYHSLKLNLKSFSNNKKSSHIQIGALTSKRKELDQSIELNQSQAFMSSRYNIKDRNSSMNSTNNKLQSGIQLRKIPSGPSLINSITLKSPDSHSKAKLTN